MSKQQSGNGTPLVRILAIIVAVLVVGCFICSTGVFVINLLLDNAPTESEPERISDPKSATLILAYSPEKADLITDLTERFNDTRQRTPDGERMQVQLVEMTPDRMVEAALDAEPDFQALSPDASLWLDQLDLRWADLHRADAGDIAPRRIADTVRYAVSPVVIAAWPEVAEELGWGSQPVGWSELQQRAAGDSDFRWSHASTSYASGMLATLAEFYAGAGKTRGLTDFAKTELKQKWGTIKKVFSSKSRLEKIVMDIMLDMEKKERLQNGRGNALLISDSIYNACRYYELFQNAGLKNCAIVTSFVPNHTDIKGEETGEGYTEKLQRFEIYRKMLAEYFNQDPNTAINKVEQFEKEVKKIFVDEPAQMKLLIVVNKLLTGFDAPSATYLYIDKRMRDHGLFQAVCRVNRLDGDDKDYGYIIDYMDLFKSLETAFTDYTSEAFDSYEISDVEGLLKERLKTGKERLEEALEAIKALCEPVEPPKDDLAHLHYFCGSNTQNPDLLKDTEPRRVALYKLTISLIRAYANIADEMGEAGYSENEVEQIRKDIKHYESLRKIVQINSGDWVDLKRFEPAMRHLIDSYIGAEESRMLANFDDLSLVELLVEKGKDALNDLPKKIRNDKDAMAETIENNLRRVIIEERPTNPMYYEKMSVLLDELIKLRKEATLEYEKYLQKIIELSVRIKKPSTTKEYPVSLNTNAKRALYDNLARNEELAIELDNKIKTTKKDGWRDNIIKTREVKYVIKEVLNSYKVKEPDAEYITKLVKNQRDY